jgi:hypothetical protein
MKVYSVNPTSHSTARRETSLAPPLQLKVGSAVRDDRLAN